MPQAFHTSGQGPNPGYWSDKVVLITGGSSGIGEATALAFGREGAQVVLLARKAAPLKLVAQKMLQVSMKPPVVVDGCDVAVEQDMARALHQVWERCGRLDAAFNNAGVVGPMSALADVEGRDFESTIRIDLVGVFNAMKHEIPLMLKTGGGVIVNTSSAFGLLAVRGFSAYCAAKFGVIGLTKAAALDYARHKIRINALCPGPVETRMIREVAGGSDEGMQAIAGTVPEGRMGTPDEMAAMVLAMCGPGASYLTGAAISVDGGQTAGLMMG